VDSSEVGSGVVVQELLDGEEWIVDTASRDGAHKAVALWKYDKGGANGAPFVYYSAELVGGAGAEQSALIAYAADALDALGWRWGPAHIEVKLTARGPRLVECTAELTARGPRLVEVNLGRFNGLDFKLLTDCALGYNAFSVVVDLFLSPPSFDALPPAPPPRLACAARLVTLVSHVSGVLESLAHQEEVHAMASMALFAPEPSPGETLGPTVDLDSFAGYAHLLHRDEEVVAADYARLRELQPSLFRVSE